MEICPHFGGVWCETIFTHKVYVLKAQDLHTVTNNNLTMPNEDLATKKKKSLAKRRRGRKEKTKERERRVLFFRSVGFARQKSKEKESSCRPMYNSLIFLIFLQFGWRQKWWAQSFHFPFSPMISLQPRNGLN